MKRIQILVLTVVLILTMCSCSSKSSIDKQNETSVTDPIDSSVKSSNDNEIFDFSIEEALECIETENSVQYIFHWLPSCEKDLLQLIEKYPLTSKYNTAAFLMVSLVRYIESPDDGLAMMDVLKGPQKLSDTEKSFIKERFSDKKYLPKSYFEGAEPSNNYVPQQPMTIVVYNDPADPPEDYSYVMVHSSGADNPRRIVMRMKDQSHYLWEYNGVLLSICLPAEEDPWVE